MDENIDVPFLWLWSCKGSSNCLNLDQAVLRVRCLPWLRSDSWSTKNGRHHVIRSPSSPRAPKISRMTSLAAHAPIIGCTCAVHGARILLLLLFRLMLIKPSSIEKGCYACQSLDNVKLYRFTQFSQNIPCGSRVFANY